MSSIIHYRFHVDHKDRRSIRFDGNTISVFQLKRDVIAQRHIFEYKRENDGKKSKRDRKEGWFLKAFDPLTDKELADDVLLNKNGAVIFRRIPICQQIPDTCRRCGGDGHRDQFCTIDIVTVPVGVPTRQKPGGQTAAWNRILEQQLVDDTDVDDVA